MIMVHTLILEVPEELYEPLVKTAVQSKQKPEELVIHWLKTAFRHSEEDPVEKFIGAFTSNVSDWADQHDKYIGQALMEEMRGQENKGG